MTNEQAYEVWAPEGGTWSPWVAPVLFTQLDCGTHSKHRLEVLPLPWAPEIGGGTAIVLDVDGVDAVRIALTLARKGMTPVPLFNASPGPLVGLSINDAPDQSSYEAVPMRALVSAMCWATEELSTIERPHVSTPVFMLDARRLGKAAEEGAFDNRWMLVPQDFPSGKFLKQHGIGRVLLVQPDRSSPRIDLVHVLRRYQEEGIEIVGAKSDEKEIAALDIKKPRFFKATFHRVLARMGLRRNAIGGFGSWVPESGGGG